MQKIIPFLWYNDQAEEAAGLYVSLFSHSQTGNLTRYSQAGATASGKPEGSAMTVNFEIEGQQFIAINGGPQFSFTPAVSFFVTLDDPQAIDRIWRKLSVGGRVLMELTQYPFSEKYGWIQDRFGVSWQLLLGQRSQKIAPCLLFASEQSGKAEQAINLYTSLFPNSKTIMVSRYGKGGRDPEGTINHAEFSLNGQEFMAMDSALEHGFTFTEAISLMVNCQTQGEIDYFWQKLTDGGQPGQCGWLKDRFGFSWQIVPIVLNDLLQASDAAKSARVMEALLKMKKIDIGALREAYEHP